MKANEDLTIRAKEIIEKILYVTIATSFENQPWNSPVYSAHDENYNFFWESWTENIHSKNIRNNPQIFIVIYDSTVPEGTGEGIYIQAKAFELTDEKEIEHALEYLDKRANKNPHSSSQFLGEMPRRVYKAVPEKIWVNIDSNVGGNYVDDRVEIEL